MNLPGPGSGITWRNYRIETPTFKLSSIEKPDLSPFLIHMTGRNQLISILKGENANEGVEVAEGQVFLKSVVPTFNGSQGYYNSNVVCFTESPLFALDFFRYRSFNRWESDQQFGIGFSKTDLVQHRNVRPVVYLETETNRELLNLCNKINDDSFVISDNNGEIQDLKPLISKIKPLLFPLLEDTRSQGFMWEREWRCPSESGMTFPLSAIKVICCPKNEREEIEKIIEEHSSHIQIVESWKEYDDVTNFLKRRDRNIDKTTIDRIDNIGDIGALSAMKMQNEQTLNTLSSYYSVFKETVNQLEGRSINDTLEDLKNTSKIISDRIEKVRIEIKAKEEQAKAKKK
ncbi:hypothetical protein ACFFVB_08505 [Formosa undariae]|uniref:DUF2971 domain-containing protein n=1 Tax=Formosa undariae TaxID=1325436 RepID=A0ABV5F115_9FLAO